MFQAGTSVNFKSQTKKFMYKWKHNYISIFVLESMWKNIDLDDLVQCEKKCDGNILGILRQKNLKKTKPYLF